MELRGSLGRSVRLFLQRNAVDSVETGSKRRHLSSTGAVVAPLIARQGLEDRLLYDPRHSGLHVCFLIATHVMKMMAHRQRRRMSLARVKTHKREMSLQDAVFRTLRPDAASEKCESHQMPTLYESGP